MDWNIWRENVVRLIWEFSNRDFQERAWFGLAGQVSSPEEMYCQLFDDLKFKEFITSEDSALSNEQRRLGQDLIRQLERYSPEGSDNFVPEFVLNDPKWQAVRNCAKAFLESIQDGRD